MMDYETLDIIKICKGRHNRNSENLSAYQALKQYYIDVYCLYPDKPLCLEIVIGVSILRYIRIALCKHGLG